MNLLAQQPSSIAKVLDTSFKLYTASFNKLIGFGLIIAVLYVGLGVMTAITVPDQTESTDTVEFLLAQTLPLFFIVIAVTLFSLILYAAIVYRIDNVANQHQDSFIEAIGLGFKKFPGMFLAIILYTIAFLIGSVLLVIPGIILSLSLAFYPFLIVIEGTSAFTSLTTSHRLVWGNWWRTLTVFMVPGILLIILFFVLGIAAAFMGEVDTGINWVDIILNLSAAFYMPFFYVLGYVQYHDLKLRKSGSDLEARMLG